MTGRVLAYDSHADVGLVALEDVRRVDPIPFAPVDYTPAVDDEVLVAGCDLGQPPTALATRITALNRFLGRPNLEVAAVPRDGRSGGGLFTADCRLIGVCNGINPIEKEGIYAAVSAALKQLVVTKATSSLAKSCEGGTQLQTESRGGTPLTRDHQAKVVSAGDASQAAKTPRSSEIEITCIVRSAAGDAPNEVFVLKAVSPAVLEMLRAAQATDSIMYVRESRTRLRSEPSNPSKTAADETEPF